MGGKDRSRKRGWKDRKMELEKHDRKKEDVKLLNVCRFHHHPHEGTFSSRCSCLYSGSCIQESNDRSLEGMDNGKDRNSWRL